MLESKPGSNGRPITKSALSLGAEVRATVEQTVAQLPVSIQQLMPLFLRVAQNSAYWVYTQTASIQKFQQELQGLQYIRLVQLPPDSKKLNYVLVEISPASLQYLVLQTVPTWADQYRQLWIQMTSQGPIEGAGVFEAWLKKQEKTGFSGYIGVYCTNQTPLVHIGDRPYDAFRVNIDTFCRTALSHQARVQFEDGSYVQPTDFAANGELKDAASWIRRCRLADTHTCLFVHIQVPKKG